MHGIELYSYGSEGVDDDGWGCVYRSFQNAMSHTGYKVIPFMGLLEATGYEWKEWSEPSDFVNIGKTVTFWTGGRAGLFRQTHQSEYAFHIPLKDVNAYIQDHKNCAFVVDNGVSGYAIVPFEGRLYWVDPHTHHPRRTLFTTQLLKSKGWMILQLLPRHM